VTSKGRDFGKQKANTSTCVDVSAFRKINMERVSLGEKSLRGRKMQVKGGLKPLTFAKGCKNNGNIGKKIFKKRGESWGIVR